MKRVAVLVVLGMLIVSASSAGAAVRQAVPNSTGDTIAYGDGKTLNFLDPASNVVTETVQIPHEPEAIATNPKDGSVWVLAKKLLIKFDAGGNRLLAKDLNELSSPGIGKPGALALNPYDGTVWVAGEKVLLQLDGSGEKLGSRRMREPVRDVAVSVDGSLWVLEGKQVSRYAADGESVTDIDLDRRISKPEFLALDDLGGYAWVAGEKGLMRVEMADGTSSEVFSIAKGTTDLAVNPYDGTVWAAGKEGLVYYGRDGNRLGAVDLGPKQAGTLSYDAANRALWAGGKKALLRLDGDGKVTGRLGVNKEARAIGTAPLRITLRLTLLSPKDGSLTNDPKPEVRLKLNALCNGTPCPPGIGYLSRLKIEASLNGRQIGELFTLDGKEATYTPDEGLPEGENTLKAQLVGPFGHRSNAVESTFTVDTIPPRFRDVKPADGAVLTEPETLITGSVDDPRASIKLHKREELGATAVSEDPRGFKYRVPLEEGENAFRLFATDRAGNQAAHALKLVYQVPIELSVKSPEQGATVRERRIAVKGVARGPSGLKVTVGEVKASIKDGVFTAEGVELQRGENEVVVKATAPDGRVEKLVLNVTYRSPDPPDDDGPIDSEDPDVKKERPPDSPLPSPGPLPPDPEKVAPPVDDSVATDTAESTRFLYEGEDAVQTGVEKGTIEERRVAILKGTVTNRGGDPVSGVRVTVHDHPEYGQTLTREDGEFDLAVNGGGQITLNYEKDRFMPAQRRVQTPWRDFVTVDDVVLVGYSTRVTEVDLAGTDGMVTARGGAVTDEVGTRQSTVLFPADATAEMVLPDGTKKPLPEMDFRATEYTVGAGGPDSMPAPLPPASGYTYAVELSADEAVEAGAKEVRFSEPVYNYTENFLGFPVGTDVPTGYYDREKAAWIPSNDGRIVKVLAIKDGKAVLDVDGSGEPAGSAALENLGITAEERGKLADLYEAGDSLWRVPIPHFTPWDHNWPYGPPEGAADPAQAPPLDPGPLAEPECESGSVIECQNQILGENLGVSGSPHALHYGSDRVRGRTAARTLDIPLTGENLPPNVKRIELEASVAGESVEKTFPAEPNQKHTLTWDATDAYGRDLIGEQDVEYRIGYVYDLVYQQPADFQRSFGQLSGIPMTASRGNREVILWQEGEAPVASWDARGQGLGGLSLDVLHQYDPEGRVLQKGDGSRRRAEDVGRVIRTVAGNGDRGYSGDGARATETRLNNPRDVVVDEDGNLYIADRSNNRVRKVSPDGTITTVAGTGSRSYSGDGGPATDAELNYPRGLAVGPDGSLYISDWLNHRIRRIDTDGIITTVAGSGYRGYSGDGGPATRAALRDPAGIAVGKDGSLYIGDAFNHRVRKVSPDGIITTVAGNGSRGFSGDGGPATKAKLNYPIGIAIGPDGNLYIANRTNHRIRKVSPDGTITTVAGNGIEGFSGDGGPADQAQLPSPYGLTVDSYGSLYIGDVYDPRVRRVGPDGLINTIVGNGSTGYAGDEGPATQAKLNNPRGLTTGPDGSLYIADWQSQRIRHVSPPLPGTSSGDITVPSEDGSELYVFDSSGKHQRTLDSVTGEALYTFSYDAEGRIEEIEDVDGLETRVERNSSGEATAIVAPNGERTELSANGEGYLTSVSNPAGEKVKLTYGEGGLLASLADPKGNTTRFSYDGRGRLANDEDPAGGFKALTRTETERGFTTTLPTAMGREKTYEVENLPTGDQRRVNTDPSGLKTEKTRNTDGSRTVKTPDGTTVETVLGPDPRFGMQSPVPEKVTVRTPGGLSSTTKTERRVNLEDEEDPLSVASVTGKTTVNGRTWTSEYEASGKRITGTTPEGRQSLATVNGKGRVVLEESPGFAPTSYTYDERGRLTEATTGTGAGARTVTYAYDGKDRVASVTDPAGRETSYAYDSAGRVTEQTLPDGRAISYTYDANGNLASLTPPGKPDHGFTYTSRDEEKTYTPPDVGGERTTTYEYNLDRQPTSVTRPGGERVEIRYDSGGRASKVVSPEGETTYAYDKETGNLTGITAPGGQKLTYTHDGTLPLTETLTGEVSGKVARKYDDSFHVTEQTVNGQSPTTYTYDKDGLLTGAGALQITRDRERALITGTKLSETTEARTHNPFGELESYEAATGTDKQYATTYKRDQLGRITEKTETVAGEETTYAYRYDKTGRLIEVEKDGRTTATYTYDKNGNRLSKETPDNTTEARYDDQDRILTHGENEYTYTADGDLKTKTNKRTGDKTTYNYDAFGNLKTAELPGGKKIEYVVDGNDRRVGKKVDGKLEQGFLYSGQLTPVAELDGNGEIVSRFVYASKANVPDYMVKGGSKYRIVSDHLGSPRLIINASTGEIAQRMTYDEFGRVTKDTNPGFQPFGFAGGLYDRDTELTRFGARDYDAEVGRWTSKDPIRFEGGDTNLYGYVVNDAVNLLDPNGTDWMTSVGESVAGFGDAVTFNGTYWVRELVGGNDAIDICSGFYGGSRRLGDFAPAGGGPAKMGIKRGIGVAANKDLLGRTILSKERTQINTSLEGGRATAKSIFRHLTKGQRVQQAPAGKGSIRRFNSDNTVQIRHKPDGTSNLDLKGRGARGVEDIHFR